MKQYIVCEFVPIFENSCEINIITISTNFDVAMKNLHNAYKNFIDDSHIIRQEGKYRVIVYKRLKGVLWDSKVKKSEYLIIEFNPESDPESNHSPLS